MHLHGTIGYELCYKGRPKLHILLDIHGFVDGDWVGDIDCKISISGYVSNLFGGVMRWIRKNSLLRHSQLQKLNIW